MQPLHPDIKSIWRLKSFLFFVALFAVVAAWAIMTMTSGGLIWRFGLLPGGIVLFGLSWTLVIPGLRYRFWRYDLRANELYLERGVWNRVRTIVPLRRIQHLDVSQDVLERNYELGRLIVHTAGTRSSSVTVPGLHYETAERLRDELRHYITEDAI